jgi:hypothetical protein
MKKRGGLILLVNVGLVFILITPSLAQVIKMTLADQNPATGWGPVHAVQPWVKKVEDATKNRVKIDIFPSQTLAKGPDIWNAVKSGVADIGWCWHGYWPDMTPLSDVITLPALPSRSAEQGSEAWPLPMVRQNASPSFPGGTDLHPENRCEESSSADSIPERTETRSLRHCH